jgi:hypothetical protein
LSFTFFFFLQVGPGNNITGPLNYDYTLAAGNYFVVSSISIDAGVTLTIEPGACLFFYANTVLDVVGTLIANASGELLFALSYSKSCFVFLFPSLSFLSHRRYSDLFHKRSIHSMVGSVNFSSGFNVDCKHQSAELRIWIVLE